MSRFAWLMAAWIGAAATGMADEKAADAVLRGKDLKRSSTAYVLPAENEAAKRLKALQQLRRELANSDAQQKAAEQQAGNAKAMIAALSRERLQLKQQMDMAQSVQERNQYVDAYNERADRINLLQNGGIDQEGIKAARAAAGKRREAYMQALLDLRNLVDEADRRYAALEADEEVKSALAELNKGRKAPLTLGPTRSFQSTVKALRAIEGTIQTGDIALRGDNGTFWLDVVLNGRHARPMVFDTGASLVSLPAKFAAEVGVTPTDDAPKVRLTTADGSTHEGRLVKLKSVRVGKFQAEDVECVVIPDKEGAPPLLGGSFLKNFTYRLNPETATLTLTQVGAVAARPTAPGRTPKSAGREAKAATATDQP